MNAPALRVLSLGAGVQSTTLLLLAAEGRLPRLDAAVFADTGWEPAAVYEHLDRLEREVAEPAGIPIYRVSAGNIRDDALDPAHRFASMPLFVLGSPRTVRDPLESEPCPKDCGWDDFNPHDWYGGEPPESETPADCPTCSNKGEIVTRWSAPRTERKSGMIRRQCTSEYKLKPIKQQVRQMLGYPHPRPVPRGVFAEQWIGISRDEFGRAKDSGIQYLRSAFPLLDLDGAADDREGWTRDDCMRYLRSRGWATTPKSACIGCPFHGNAAWRRLRDETPDEWADAVDFDRAIRAGNARGNANGSPLRGEAYLHRSRLPLDQAPIDRVTAHEWAQQQTDVFGQIADQLAEDGDPDGCSPWSCRSGLPIDAEDAA